MDALQRDISNQRREQGLPSDPTFKVALAAVTAARMPSERERSQQREQWIESIRRRVNDPKLKVSVMVKVASAVVDGHLKPGQVTEIFAELDEHRRKGTLKRAPGIYFSAFRARTVSSLRPEMGKTSEVAARAAQQTALNRCRSQGRRERLRDRLWPAARGATGGLRPTFQATTRRRRSPR